VGTAIRPRYRALPVTATSKINKQPLRLERWSPSSQDDVIWWRPDPRQASYVRMTPADADDLAGQFTRNGRTVLLAQETSASVPAEQAR
jgi:hypothetical protein